MLAETIKGKALPFVLMKPARFRMGAGYPLVILLHDFGASMYDLTGIASGMNDRGYVYACPNGPYSVKYGLGTSGSSWFQPKDAEPAKPDLDELLEVFVEEARELAGIETGKVGLIGVGDGGEVALRYGLLHPERFHAVGSLNGSIPNAEEFRVRLPNVVDLRVFLSQSSSSEAALAESRALRLVLEAAGYPLFYREYETVRNVVAGEQGPDGEEYDLVPDAPRRDLPDLIAWLKEALPPY